MRKNIFMALALMTIAVFATACGNEEGKEMKKEVTTVEITSEAEATTHVENISESTTEKKTKEAVTKTQETKEKKTEVATTEKKTEKITEKVTEKPTKRKKEKVTKINAEENKKKAKKYIGKSLDELVSKIGKYKKMEKAKSCLVEGEFDGMFYYDDFIVSASTENGEWIVSSVD